MLWTGKFSRAHVANLLGCLPASLFATGWRRPGPCANLLQCLPRSSTQCSQARRSSRSRSRRGYDLFRGQAQCNACHRDGGPGEDPLFTDFTASNIGTPANPRLPYYREDRPDALGYVANPGRWSGWHHTRAKRPSPANGPNFDRASSASRPRLFPALVTTKKPCTKIRKTYSHGHSSG
jgi:hypothetical protein